MIKIVKNERGFGLVEVLMALALLGIIAVAFIMAIAVASQAILIADERTTAESLARSQLEYIKEQPYVYDEIVTDEVYAIYNGIDIEDDYPSFRIYSENRLGEVVEDIIGIPWNSATGEVADPDEGLQMIKLVIQNNGEEVLVLEDYKVDR